MPNRHKLPPTLYVVDDDAMVREALDGLLRSFGYQVRCFASTEAFRHHRRAPGPACLILDVRMPGQDGLAFQDELIAAGETLPVIFLTAHGDVPMAVRAMRGGAIEFLLKPFAADDLIQAVRVALARHKRHLVASSKDMAERKRFDMLTPRERRIVALVVAGSLNKQIAAALGLSEITVKVHRARIMHKLEVNGVAALTALVHRLGVEGERDPAVQDDRVDAIARSVAASTR